MIKGSYPLATGQNLTTVPNSGQIASFSSQELCYLGHGTYGCLPARSLKAAQV